MSTGTFVWHVDRFAFFGDHLYAQGWAFHTGFRLKSLLVKLPNGRLIRAKGYPLASPDVAEVHGDGAARCRFSVTVPVASADQARRSALLFRGEGRSALIAEPTRTLSSDPFHQLFPRFQRMVQAMPRPMIVEIGSRARSGNVNTGWLPEGATYRGFDIVEGPNVDVVGDAHRLSERFEHSSIDAVFSVSTFEHLAMPWQVVAQLNRILRTGGLTYIGSHQTWPLHDSPWDFWRFSSSAWHALLNEETGFTVVEAVMGDGASTVADHLSLGTEELGSNPGFLGSAVIARKTHSSELSWDVDPAAATERGYPT
jgi:Methyltransferase domain